LARSFIVGRDGTHGSLSDYRQVGRFPGSASPLPTHRLGRAKGKSRATKTPSACPGSTSALRDLPRDLTQLPLPTPVPASNRHNFVKGNSRDRNSTIALTARRIALRKRSQEIAVIQVRGHGRETPRMRSKDNERLQWAHASSQRHGTARPRNAAKEKREYVLR
jgi:hypothetical protein